MKNTTSKRKSSGKKKIDTTQIGKILILIAIGLGIFSIWNISHTINSAKKEKATAQTSEKDEEINEDEELRQIISEALANDSGENSYSEGRGAESSEDGSTPNQENPDTNGFSSGQVNGESYDGLKINTDAIEVIGVDADTLALINNDAEGLGNAIQEFANGYGLQGSTQATFTGESYINSKLGTVTLEFKYNNDASTGVEIIFDKDKLTFSARSW